MRKSPSGCVHHSDCGSQMPPWCVLEKLKTGEVLEIRVIDLAPRCDHGPTTANLPIRGILKNEFASFRGPQHLKACNLKTAAAPKTDSHPTAWSLFTDDKTTVSTPSDGLRCSDRHCCRHLHPVYIEGMSVLSEALRAHCRVLRDREDPRPHPPNAASFTRCVQRLNRSPARCNTASNVCCWEYDRMINHRAYLN